MHIIVCSMFGGLIPFKGKDTQKNVRLTFIVNWSPPYHHAILYTYINIRKRVSNPHLSFADYSFSTILLSLYVPTASPSCLTILHCGISCCFCSQYTQNINYHTFILSCKKFTFWYLKGTARFLYELVYYIPFWSFAVFSTLALFIFFSVYFST